MTEPKMVTTAVIISLAAGVLIILGSLYAMAGMWILGVVSGILVLFSAIMLKIRPGEATRGLRTCCLYWGSAILLFSIIGVFGGSISGFLVGAILGVVGGVLALATGSRITGDSSRPTSST